MLNEAKLEDKTHLRVLLLQSSNTQSFSESKTRVASNPHLWISNIQCFKRRQEPFILFRLGCKEINAVQPNPRSKSARNSNWALTKDQHSQDEHANRIRFPAHPKSDLGPFTRRPPCSSFDENRNLPCHSEEKGAIFDLGIGHAERSRGERRWERGGESIQSF